MQVKDTLTPYDLSSRLVLLLLHYPALKLIWSTSPYETAKIFAALKRSSPNPLEPHNFKNKGNNEPAEDNANPVDRSYVNTAAREILLRMPGITTKNVHRFMNCSRWRSVAEMVQKATLGDYAEIFAKNGMLSEEECSKMAAALHTFLHAKLNQQQTA